VTGVEIEPKFFAVAKGFKGPLSSLDIEGDFGRMNLQGEPHATFREDIEDRVPAVGEQFETVGNHRFRHRWE